MVFVFCDPVPRRTKRRRGRSARCLCLGAVIATLAACADGKGLTAGKQDAPAGVYPAGELSGGSVYHIGWKRPLYR
jgi:hypothetical protein